MKLADRLRRLEMSRDSDGRMTPDAIEAAAAEFNRKIASMATRPVRMTPEQALSNWHILVNSPNPGWWQRIFAAAEPEDWFV